MAKVFFFNDTGLFRIFAVGKASDEQIAYIYKSNVEGCSRYHLAFTDSISNPVHYPLPRMPQSIQKTNRGHTFWSWLNKGELKCTDIKNDQSKPNPTLAQEISTKTSHTESTNRKTLTPTVSSRDPFHSQFEVNKVHQRQEAQMKTFSDLSVAGGPQVREKDKNQKETLMTAKQITQKEEFLNLANYITNLQSQLMNGIKAAVIFFQTSDTDNIKSKDDGMKDINAKFSQRYKQDTYQQKTNSNDNMINEGNDFVDSTMNPLNAILRRGEKNGRNPNVEDMTDASPVYLDRDKKLSMPSWADGAIFQARPYKNKGIDSEVVGDLGKTDNGDKSDNDNFIWELTNRFIVSNTHLSPIINNKFAKQGTVSSAHETSPPIIRANVEYNDAAQKDYSRGTDDDQYLFGKGFGIVRFFQDEPHRLQLQLFRKIADLPLEQNVRRRRSVPQDESAPLKDEIDDSQRKRIISQDETMNKEEEKRSNQEEEAYTNVKGVSRDASEQFLITGEDVKKNGGHSRPACSPNSTNNEHGPYTLASMHFERQNPSWKVFDHVIGT